MNVNSSPMDLRNTLPACDYSSYQSVKEWEENHGEVADQMEFSAPAPNESLEMMKTLGQSVAQLPSGEEVPQCDYGSAQSVNEWEELYGASVDAKPSEAILSADFQDAVAKLDAKGAGQSVPPKGVSADIVSKGNTILENVRTWDGNTESDSNWSPRAVTLGDQALSAAVFNASNSPITLAQQTGSGKDASAVYIRQQQDGQTDMFTMTRTANNGVSASKVTLDPLTGTAWLIA